MPASMLRRAAARIHGRGSVPEAPAGARIALASLRSVLDERSQESRWALHPDGVLGRALIVETGGAARFPLRLAGLVTLSARAMLLPHDWRDRHGAVEAWVDLTDRHGRVARVWSHRLSASDLAQPRGHQIELHIPGTTAALTLGVDRTGNDATLQRAIWLEPVLNDPGGPALRPEEPAPRRASAGTPLISVLVPVHDPPPEMLEAAVQSVREQTYANWELRLVDDGSADPAVVAALKRYAAADPRIHVTRHETPGGISAATNAALRDAAGEFVGLLDHDDTLTPDALQQVVDALAARPDLDMIYSDEDVVGDGGWIERHVKPGWSPEHMAALMYTCHLGVYRRSVATELGGFATRFDGCQDYDFVLRLMEHTDRIAHVPRILYHWRSHAGSTAGGDQAKPLAYLAQPRAIEEHLQRSGIDAEVQFGQAPGLHRVVHRVDPATTVDLVLAVRSADGLAEAAESWLAQPHPSWRLILTAPPDVLDHAAAVLQDAGVESGRLTTVLTPADADRTGALARAAEASAAEHLLLMQTPALGLTHDWLTRLIGYSAQDGIAAAGPVLLAPDGRILQAGIALPDGIPLHLHYGAPARAAPPAVYNLSAVSGLLCTPRATYEQLGGLQPQHRDLALIDYCLRAGDTGQRTVIVPDARLRATGEGGVITTINDLPAIWHLRAQWATTHTHDPYYNPNYRTDRGDFVLQHYD